ncbi:MAG: hypoxanthine phosphoribosyltransferase [Deltaproteobacteria bacterium]|nr:MAG: hypoxanthine phosphoribosyltransferase [Deltaproteobacteria bacterium]TNF28740.1 MAG: hypoxanthine phosphoribosyltransferase [Deltaproteobacteria bacterium]
MAVDVYISEEKIQARIKELGEQITKDFNGEEVTVVGVLNGAFMFVADLIRAMDLPVVMEFIKASSYGDGTVSKGKVDITLDIQKDIKGKNVLVVEDIVDTGLTLTGLLEDFKQRDPKNLKLASLLFKPARCQHKVNIDYLGFEIEDKFVIGYGLDYAGKYRELPFIGVYSEDF